VIVNLTNKGHLVAKFLELQFSVLGTNAIRGFNDKEVQTLNSLLIRVFENIRDVEQEAGPPEVSTTTSQKRRRPA
jgi:hypothetical protein